MTEHPVNDLMSSTMEKIKAMVDANTVVGQPIVTGEVTIIPVSRVSFGFASGGSDFASKHQKPGENVRLLPVIPPSGPIDRAIDVVPEVVDKITNFVEKQQEKKDNAGF